MGKAKKWFSSAAYQQEQKKKKQRKEFARQQAMEAQQAEEARRQQLLREYTDTETSDVVELHTPEDVEGYDQEGSSRKRKPKGLAEALGLGGI